MRAHPRSRGENGERAALNGDREGSSPLTRGKPLQGMVRPRTRRLIPAHAGKTALAGPLGPLGWAHPRSRGENSPFMVGVALTCGSSPLTRGKPSNESGVLRGRRLIPAHAGKTMRREQRRPGSGAHPRSRGENLVDAHVCGRHYGSSPLTRGKRWYVRPRPRTAVAHPRSRGENFDPSACGHLFRGSSPLTRGKPDIRVSLLLSVRLIPAHAGKTSMYRRVIGHLAAHPRSRGENAGRTSTGWSATGSSPLTRGKLEPTTVHGLRERLIPAHAGKTYVRLRE